MDPELLRYATGWDEAIGARVLFALLGVLIVGWIIQSFRSSPSGFVGRFLAAVAGVFCLAFAAIPQQVVNLIIRTEYLTRIRLIMAGLSILVLLITFESLRKTRLQERYALLWVATAAVILVAALFPHVVDLFRAVTGMSYAMAVVAIAFTFLVLVAFHFSISLSRFAAKQSKIAQRIALLEARVRRMETERRSDPDANASP